MTHFVSFSELILHFRHFQFSHCIRLTYLEQ